MLAIPDSDRHPSLAEKAAFLGGSHAYPGAAGPVGRRETHMSLVFFVDGTVYKLKKPVRLPYLDFSTLARREAACRAEVALNRTLAPDVYRGVERLVRGPGGLRLGGPGEVVDWLVVMRRLDEARTLEARLLARDCRPADVDALARALARFYRRARPVRIPAALLLRRWRSALLDDERVLLDPDLGLPRGLVRRILGVERAFLRTRRALLASRSGRILDAHGDLRPEHVWTAPEITIIDRLEFSAELRAVDPLDELAFLDLECERLAAPAAGRRLRHRLAAALHEAPAPELYLFYRIGRALLRARLSIAHLLEPDPRTPEKWPRQARAYLAIAARDAVRLEARLRTPGR